MLELLLELRKAAIAKRDAAQDGTTTGEHDEQIHNEGRFAAYDDMLEEIESTLSENFDDSDWLEESTDLDLEDEDEDS
ncbi:hypothetical protein VPHD148_0176 [Vibrio phage D148]